MSLAEKLKKNSTIKETAMLSESTFFEKKDLIRTSVPALNVAFSGSLDGGFGSGLTLICGPSKHFKTSFALVCAKAYLDKYDDSMILFYDSEFGTPQSYFESFNIPMDRVVHTPITDIEQLKFDLMQQINNLDRKDRVIIVIDSVGNLASKKESEDALDGKSVTDMTRAKSLKSLFRIVTPHLTIKDIPLIAVNHIYMEQGAMYPKAIVSGGSGIYLSADNIFIIGRQQDKDSSGVVGYNFIINIEKSRFVREKSKIPVSVSFEGGISPWSALLELGIEFGYVTKPKAGWYARVDKSTGELSKNYRESDTSSSEFWMPILKNPQFNRDIEERFKIANSQMVSDEEVNELFEQIED